jgi:hypothetical protein
VPNERHALDEHLNRRRHAGGKEVGEGASHAIIAAIEDAIGPASPSAAVIFVVLQDFFLALKNAQSERLTILIGHELVCPPASHLLYVLRESSGVG